MTDANIPSPSPWQPDDTAPVCMLCKRGFNIFRWRHHCRICGKVFCNFCTPHRARVQGYLDLERICILCKSATLKSIGNMTIATPVVPLSNPAPVVPLSNSTPVVPLSSPEPSLNSKPRIERIPTTLEGSADDVVKVVENKVPTNSIDKTVKHIVLNVNTPSPVAATNGWTLVKSDVDTQTGRTIWTMCQPLTNAGIKTRKERRQSSEIFVQSIPFCDYLVVGGGVDLVVNDQKAWIAGTIILLDGSCWNPGKRLLLNGRWHVSTQTMIKGKNGKQTIYVPWQVASSSIKDFLRGDQLRQLLGPEFLFETFSNSQEALAAEICPPRACLAPKHIFISQNTVQSEIKLNNGFYLLRDQKWLGCIPKWDLRLRTLSKGLCSQKFIDCVSIAGVMLHSGLGNLWIEGVFEVRAGAALSYSGGGWIFNGMWNISPSACEIVRDSRGKTIAVVPWNQKSTSLRKYVCAGRSYYGKHFGPNFSCNLLADDV